MLLFSNMAHGALSAISPWSPHRKLMDAMQKKSLRLMHGWSGRKGGNPSWLEQERENPPG